MQNEIVIHPVTLICVGAPADAALLVQWETHLLLLQRAGLLTFWSERHIRAGVSRPIQFATHIEDADCVILLISADFFADAECLTWMQRALLRQQENSAIVIPLLLRPVEWQESEVASLPCLPANKIPLTQWSDLDEAFRSCAQELRTLLPLPNRQTPTQEKLQPEQKNVLSLYRIPKSLPFSPTNNFTFSHHLWKIAIFIFITSFLLGTCLLTIAVVRPAWCFPSFCQPLATTNSPNTVYDKNLEISLIDIHHIAFEIPGNPLNWSENTLPEDNDAVLIGQTNDMYQIILGVHNLQANPFDLLIEKVSLLVDKVEPVPYPFNVWNVGSAVNYTTNPYLAMYNDEPAGTVFAANYEQVPYAHVHLTANESDELSVQISSRVTAAVQFQIQLTYSFATESQQYPPLLLPKKFEVVFSDANNWHVYQLRDGRFVSPGQP